MGVAPHISLYTHKGVQLTFMGVGRVLGATPRKGGVLGRFKGVLS